MTLTEFDKLVTKIILQVFFSDTVYFIMTLLKICHRMCQWRNFENRSILAKIWTKVSSLLRDIWRTRYAVILMGDVTGGGRIVLL